MCHTPQPVRHYSKNKTHRSTVHITWFGNTNILSNTIVNNLYSNMIHVYTCTCISISKCNKNGELSPSNF